MLLTPVFTNDDFICDLPKIGKKKESTAKEETDKNKTASSKKSTSRKIAVKTVEIEPSPNAVIITARYDKFNRLIELVMKKVNLRIFQIMPVIALLAPYCSSLSKIVMQCCRINASVIYDLSKMLQWTAITEICLDDSPLPEANYAILLNVEGNVLKHLSLARCLINDVVCEQLSTKLHYNMIAENQLLTLNLSSNHITDEGAKFLANALRTNRRLRYLNLANNCITDIGFSHILDTLTEFHLTPSEMAQKKVCYVEYLKKRVALSMDQLHFTGRHSLSDSMDSLRGSKINMKKRNDTIVSAKSSTNIAPKYSAGRIRGQTEIVEIKKNKTQNREMEKVNSAKSVITNSKQPETNNPKDFSSLLDCLGPFKPSTVVEKDGWTYSKGNLELSYLNVAYNDLTLIGMRQLSTVLTYQSQVRQLGETGLIKIHIEGNLLPSDCPEIRTINNILANFFTGKRSSKTKNIIIT